MMQDEWPLARIVEVMNFGELVDVVIIGYDLPTEQVRYSNSPHGGNGSAYIKASDLAKWNEPSPTYSP